VFLIFFLHFILTEPALFRGEQMASAGWDGAVLRQRLCVPLPRRQTSDPEEVMMMMMLLRCLQGQLVSALYATS